MEERPSERAQEKRYHHHGEERSPCGAKKTLKNGQSRFEHQEAQAKTAGNGRLNGNAVEGEKIIFTDDSIGISGVTYTNGTRQHLDTNFKPRQQGKAAAAPLKVVSRISPRRNSMNCRNEKSSDCIPHELVDKDSVLPLNGLVSLNPSYIANGYPGKPAQDSDGSNSESGHATPKKRRDQCIKGTEASHLNSAVPAIWDSEPSSPELAEKAAGQQSDPARVDRALPAGAELQRRNSDIKSSVASGKKMEDRTGRAKFPAPVIVKEDSWTLFRPPPVFPVDNSSAKIVPKISYASKVKENLNKTSQVSAEVLAPGKLSQVPMSAMKTITSPSFTNGPVYGDGSTLAPAQPLLSAAPATEGQTSCLLASENVAPSPHNDGCSSASSSTATCEMRKSAVFVNTLSLSSVQPALPSACLENTPAVAAGRKTLGDIFHNQWGLSFINEPSAGPQADKAAADVACQEECPASLTPVKASRLDKRTTTLSPGGVPRKCLETGPAGDGIARTQPLAANTRKADTDGQGKLAPVSPRDSGVDRPSPAPTSHVTAMDKELDLFKGSDWTCSCDLFDLKAAVVYHTKEIEKILNLQRQDPKRVVVYDESMDGPGQ